MGLKLGGLGNFLEAAAPALIVGGTAALAGATGGLSLALGLGAQSIFSGIKRGEEARHQANIEAGYMQEEAKREEQRRVQLAEDTVEQQKSMILAQGTLLEGAPLLLLLETRRKSLQEIEDIRAVTRQRVDLMKRGTRSQYTSNLVGGISNAANIILPRL